MAEVFDWGLAENEIIKINKMHVNVNKEDDVVDSGCSCSKTSGVYTLWYMFLCCTSHYYHHVTLLHYITSQCLNLGPVSTRSA